MVCPRCRHAIPAGASRCITCGAAFAQSSIATRIVPIDTTGLPPGATFGASTSLGAGATLDPGANAVEGSTIGELLTVDGTSRPPTMGPLAIGQAFGPRYHIIKLLGAGGMGAVYQAWDAELGVAVAVKVIRIDRRRATVSSEIEKRFKNELLLARQVTHKNVVRIHDLGEINGIKYITMPYVQGDDLAKVMRVEGRLPIARALRLARHIADGLQAAHDAGVVHRDLKPANVMIGADDQALIMDFGISASASETTSEGVIGTLEYMAPEQSKGEVVDARADIYAFGLILHEMLTGPQPVTAATAQERIDAMKRRVSEGLPSVRTIDPSISLPLDAVVSTCLQLDPAARFETTADLCTALAKLDDAGELIPEPRRLTKPMMAATAAVVTLLLGATYLATRTLVTPAKAHEVVPVLVSDFQNRTGDPSFDGSVEQALTIAMEGASYVRVFPREEARTVARQLVPSSGGRIDQNLGARISQREDIKVLLSGAIDKVANGFRVSVEAINPADSKVIVSTAETVSDKLEVVPAVGSLARRIRGRLGESEGDIAKFPETYTTTSLDAMGAYTRGQDLLERGNYLPALAAFEQAVSHDPEFGRAYALIGTVYSNLKELDKAEASFQQALKRVDRMTEREKYRTLAGYSLFVARNYPKAIENYEKLLELYPADAAPYNNLSLAYLYARNIPKALEVSKLGVEAFPRSMVRRSNYAYYAMYAADFKTATAEANHVIKENPSYEFAYLPLALSSIATGDIQSGRDTFTKLHTITVTGDSLARLGEADLEMYLGNNRAAIRILRDGIDRDVKAGNRGMAASKNVALAESWLALGDRSQAAAAALRAASLNDHESVLFPAARVLIASGRESEARKIAMTLESKLQTQTTSYARLIAGEIALKASRWTEAIEALRDAQKRDDSWFAHYLLGRVYWESGNHAPEALEEFDLCLKRRGETTDIFFYDTPTLRYLPPLFYWAARAHEAVGAPASARANYEQFIKVRAEADPPDPLVADARQRLATPAR